MTSCPNVKRLSDRRPNDQTNRDLRREQQPDGGLAALSPSPDLHFPPTACPTTDCDSASRPREAVLRLDDPFEGRPAYYAATLSAMRRLTGRDSLPLGLLTPEFLDRYVADLALSGLSKSTAESYMRALRALANAAARAAGHPRPAAFADVRTALEAHFPHAAGRCLPASRQPAPSEAHAARPRWRVVRNRAYPSRDDIAAIVDTVAPGADRLIPRLEKMVRDRDGRLRRRPDPLLEPLLFARLSADEADAMQRALDRRATILFSLGQDGRRIFSAVPDDDMVNFAIAIGAGADALRVETEAPLAPGQTVRVVGHPLFDGLIGRVDPRSRADALPLRVTLRGAGLTVTTTAIPRCQLRPLHDSPLQE